MEQEAASTDGGAENIDSPSAEDENSRPTSMIRGGKLLRDLGRSSQGGGWG